MRTGFSTSACAAAAAVAVLRALTGGETVANVAIDLPTRRGVAFSTSQKFVVFEEEQARE